MKSLAALVLIGLSAVSQSALASPPVEYAPGIDKEREGKLNQKVVEFYTKEINHDACEHSRKDPNQEVTEISAIKIDSMSEAPAEGITYRANYLVLKYCFDTAVHGGAYRNINAAALVRGEFSPETGGKPRIAYIREVNLKDLQFPLGN